MAGPASAHEERPAEFPDGTGSRPVFLGLDNPRHRVVCRPESGRAIDRMAAGPLKKRNKQLLRECSFGSIQSAINTIKHRRTSVYVLPGTYTEKKWATKKRSDYCSHLKSDSKDPLSAVDYIGSLPDPSGSNEAESDPIALSYDDQRRCAHSLNLIAIFGDDTPRNDSIKCDSVFCGTQVVGTGPRKSSVVIDNRSHHNTLGYSGTADNSVHGNRFYDNATGISTDSLFPGHPGLPQDHARWNDNKVYSNNENWYTRYVDKGVCEKPMAKRGYLHGTVCPVVPVPVGTGVLIAGGNLNSTDHNWIYDNWRYGTMQIWVPAPLRDEFDPTKLYDTSNNNHTFANTMGITPGGATRHNGMDHWWDDEGGGNCWEDNTSSRGQATDNFTVDPPSCADGGSVFTPGGSAVKDSGFLSCSQYDRHDPTLRHPPHCNWFDSPPKPTDESGDPFAPVSPKAGSGDRTTSGPTLEESLSLLAVVPILGTGAVLGGRTRRRGRA